MTVEYIGDPANRSTSTRVILDSDDQRAVTYNPAIQQAADNYAYIRRAESRLAITSMLELEGSEEGDIQYTIYGAYRFFLGSPTLVAPWQYVSIGTPSGYWEHTLYTLAAVTTKGIARLGPMSTADTTPTGRIPIEYTQRRNVVAGWIYYGVAFTDTTPAGGVFARTLQLNHTASVVAGDEVTGSFGPLMVRNDDLDTPGQIALDATYTLTGGSTEVVEVAVLSTGSIIVGDVEVPMTVTIPYWFSATQTGTLGFRLRAIAGESHALYTKSMVHLASGLAWLGNYTVIRP